MIFVVTIIFSVVCWVIEQRRTSILSVLIWVVPFRFDSLSSYYEPKAVFVDTRTVCFESRGNTFFYDIWYLELQMTLPWLILMYKKIKHTKKFPFYWAVEYVDSHVQNYLFVMLYMLVNLFVQYSSRCFLDSMISTRS